MQGNVYFQRRLGENLRSWKEVADGRTSEFDPASTGDVGKADVTAGGVDAGTHVRSLNSLIAKIKLATMVFVSFEASGGTLLFVLT